MQRQRFVQARTMRLRKTPIFFDFKFYDVNADAAAQA
jgi:orotidine-5'-phosphate decarboxylase